MASYINIHTHLFRAGERAPRAEGIHPWEAEQWRGEEPIISPDCDVVGEIGLDALRGGDLAHQEALFRRQLAIAQERKIPVVLHCVKCFEMMMKILSDYRLKAVVFHGFIGSYQQAKRALDRAYFLSFGERSLASPRTREVMRQVPLEQLFLETDESPISIREIYRQVAALRQIDEAYLIEVLEQNYKRIIR